MNETTLRKFNRRILKSQFLSRKARGRDSLEAISAACCGINSQNFQDSFLSFWVRSKSFNDASLLSQLKPRGTLTRTWTVRGTVHTFPSRDYYIHVYGAPRNRILSRHDSYAKILGLPERDKRIDLLYHPLLDEIKGEMVSSKYVGDFISERLERLGIKGKRLMHRGWSNEPKYGPVWEGLMEMSYLGLIVNAGRDGSTSMWMPTRDWLTIKVSEPDPQECATKLIRSYIESYGPVSFSDILYWTGHRKMEARNSISALKNELQESRIGGSREVFYTVSGEGTTDPAPPSAIILPRFDSLMMGHSDKSRYMLMSHRNHIFTSTGIINPTLLLDGFAAGTWRKERSGKGRISVAVAPFRALGHSEKNAIEEKFAELGEYLKGEVQVGYQGSA